MRDHVMIYVYMCVCLYTSFYVIRCMCSGTSSYTKIRTGSAQMRSPQESAPPIRLEAISPLGGIRGTDPWLNVAQLQTIQPPNGGFDQ